MTEHPIRLRGGWELREPSGGHPERLTLPLVGFPRSTTPVRLYRSFHVPAVDPAREELWLRLEAVPGLAEVRFNGRALPRPHAGALVEHLRLDLDAAVPATNELMLRVDVAPEPLDPPWGIVALVIRSA